MAAFRFPLLYAPKVHGTSLVGPCFLLCRTRKHLWPITLLGRSYLSICSNAGAKLMEPRRLGSQPTFTSGYNDTAPIGLGGPHRLEQQLRASSDEGILPASNRIRLGLKLA